MMNSAAKLTEFLLIMEETDEMGQVHEEVVSQAASPLSTYDEALLEELLEVGGLKYSCSSRNSKREPMQCYACRDKTYEHCSYCLCPVCQEHGRQVQLWISYRQVMVCTPCQAQLREVAQQEQNLNLA